MRTLTLIAILVFSFTTLSMAMAKEQSLASVSRSDDGGSLRFSAVLNDVSDLNGLAFSTSNTRIYVTVGEIDNRSKVVYRDSNQDVISLKATNFSLYSGGTLELVYLQEYNMFSSNTYRKLKLSLEREGDTWFLSKDGRRVTGLKLNIYRWGISSIDVFYAK